jgi:PAS domain S-box-containing protein
VRPSPLGSYESQVKIFLTLLVLFLGVAIYFNVHLLVVARNAIQEEVGHRLSLQADLVRAELERDQMLRGLRADAGGVPYIPPTFLDRMARQRGMARIEILNLDGRVMSSSDPGRVGGQDELLEEDGGSRRGRLLAGGRLVIPAGRPPGASSARLAAYRPLLDRSYVAKAFIKIEEEVPVLSSVDLNLKLISALQAAGLVFVLVLVILFSRWLLQPYRRLARAAGEAPGAIAGLSAPGRADEPDDLVRAFQGVLETLRRQEGELLALKQGRAASADAPLLPGDHLIRGMTSGVLVFGHDGRLRVLNEAAERLLGLPRDAAVGRGYADLLGENRRLADLVERCLTTGESRSREVVPLAGPSGRRSHLGAMISPIRGAAGEAGDASVEGALCLLADLTEIKSLREKVALKENLAALGEMSAGIAHEFRNSLATIQGLARLITRPGRNGGGPPGPADENAEAILREVRGIAKVVDDFLRFARPASLELSEVDPKGLAEDLVEEFRDDPVCRGIRLEVRGGGPRILADETLLRQALHNLLLNAAEALAATSAGEGGAGPAGEERRIVVIVAADPAAPGGASIAVEDNGGGIPPADLPRIFAPFFTTKDRGTGLGLALVQKTAVVHDGRVEVESRPGGATRFTLILPARPGTPGPSPPL